MSNTDALVKPEEMVFLSKDQQVDVGKVKDFLTDLQMGHSEYQIKNFILSDENYPTPAAKYHQAKIEAWVRYQTLMEQIFEYRKADNDIKAIELDLEATQLGIEGGFRKGNAPDMKRATLQKAMLEDEIRKRQVRMTIIENSAKHTYREMKIFLDAVEENLELCGGEAPSADEISEERWKNKIPQIPQSDV